MKKIITKFTFILLMFISTFPIFAVNEGTPNNLHIIPQSTKEWGEKAETIVERIWDTKGDGTVLSRYNNEATKIANEWDLWKAFETWVMSRDTLLSYIVYLMRFINQVWLLVWSVMILYAGYLYATSVFKQNNTSSGKSAIKNAIIGILVIIFSYAIWAGLEAMFL